MWEWYWLRGQLLRESDRQPGVLIENLLQPCEWRRFVPKTHGICRGQPPRICLQLNPAQWTNNRKWKVLPHAACKTLLSSPGNALLTQIYQNPSMRYGTEFHSRTVASLKPEISQAKHSLLDEIASTDEAKVIHGETTSFRENCDRRPPRPPTKQPGCISSRKKLCPFCKQSGRTDSRLLSKCRFLPERDRKYMSKASQIAPIF